MAAKCITLLQTDISHKLQYLTICLLEFACFMVQVRIFVLLLHFLWQWLIPVFWGSLPMLPYIIQVKWSQSFETSHFFTLNNFFLEKIISNFPNNVYMNIPTQIFLSANEMSYNFHNLSSIENSLLVHHE